MKLILFFASLALLPTLVFGQTNERWDGSMTTAQGQAVAGASVTIETQPGLTLTTLFANSSGAASPVNCGTLSGVGNQINNPLTTNGTGQVCAYLPAGTCYTVTYSSPLTGTQSYPDQGASCSALSAGFLPLTGGTLTGPLIGPSVTASVNSQINVMAPPYNATGSCSTHDTDAIQQAITDAYTNTPTPATVYFPVPPGGCYLVGTLNYLGVALQGQAPTGVLPPTGAGVVLKGLPGQDILHFVDPNTSGSAPLSSWSIRDITFEVDDSTDVSGTNTHRWPGRWATDGAMTASSAVLTSANSEFSCSDVGQAVVVYGAGTGGANLTTTVSAVSPCWRNGIAQVVTLAAAASTTVSNANVYVAPANISATQHIGNCAIAADNYDGNSSDWTIGGVFNDGDVLRDVLITSTSGTRYGQHNSCGIFFQGIYQPYGLDARNVNIQRTTWGVVEASYDTNPQSGPMGQDYQKWDHGDIQATYPWISYNGEEFEWEGYQLDAIYGPQVLKVASSSEGFPSMWRIDVPEMENTSGGVGWRIEGYRHVASQIEMCAGSTGYIDTGNSYYTGSCVNGSLVTNGQQNQVTLVGTFNNTSIVTDNGAGNIVTGAYSSNPLESREASTALSLTANRGPVPMATKTADFIRAGNVNTPYYGDATIFFWPEDLLGSGTNAPVLSDSNSWTGRYSQVSSALEFTRFSNLFGAAVIGTAVPATTVIVYVSAKCPSITSFGITVYAGSTNVGSASATCSTSYTQTAVTANLSSYAGQNLGVNIGSGETDVAYIAVRPYQADYNGYQPAHSGANSDITSLTGLTTPLTVAQGGTGTGTSTGTGSVVLSNSPSLTGSPTTTTITVASGRRGTFVCTAAGTITISNANMTAGSDVTITMETAGGTITTPPAFKTVTASTGFTVLCGASDTSTYRYTIWN